MSSENLTTAKGARQLDGLNLRLFTPWVIAAVLLAVLPLYFTSGAALTIMNQMAITIIFALAYNMLLGQGGMLSFGHAVYMGLGGFFCVHLMNMVENDGLLLPLPLLPLFGGFFGLFFAFLIGLFSTRRAGTVFAMISLGVGELIAACSIIVVVFFGGEEGISGDRTMGPTVFGLDFGSKTQVYYLTAIWLIISAAAMYFFSRTPIGRVANAVRDNPERAEFIGYSQRYVRFYSFCASGFFAGVAGGLFAINFEILTEENLNLTTSGSILLVTFLGGVGFFIGPIIGAVVFTLLQSVISLKTEIWQLYLGILFVSMVMFFPRGLTGLIFIHLRPYQLGKLGMILVEYGKLLVPALLTVAGAIGLLETAFHAKHAPKGEEAMSLMWISFNSHSLWPWLLFIAMALGGGYLLKKMTPAFREIWDRANSSDAA